MSSHAYLTIGNGCLDPSLDPGTLLLRVPDVCGSYTIPYIQSARELRVAVAESAPPGLRRQVALCSGTTLAAVGEITAASDPLVFEDLAAGEYTLEVRSPHGSNEAAFTIRRIGVGTVIAAIGDSIAEGYCGPGFFMADLDLTAAAFPAHAVSADGRNFPQYAPTTGVHLPETNCFRSWMPRLNDLLTAASGQPVFIANEGWGGYGTGDYLRLMRMDRNWQQRMHLLRPNLWLVHLGVNDERAATPVADVTRNLSAIVDELEDRYGATPDRILLAKPCYDYLPGARFHLEAYCRAIDALVAARGLAPGPDFFTAYAESRSRWYGLDPVHPNEEGMNYMAKLWEEAIARALTQESASRPSPTGIEPANPRDSLISRARGMNQANPTRPPAASVRIPGRTRGRPDP